MPQLEEIIKDFTALSRRFFLEGSILALSSLALAASYGCTVKARHNITITDSTTGRIERNTERNMDWNTERNTERNIEQRIERLSLTERLEIKKQPLGHLKEELNLAGWSKEEIAGKSDFKPALNYGSGLKLGMDGIHLPDYKPYLDMSEPPVCETLTLPLWRYMFNQGEYIFSAVWIKDLSHELGHIAVYKKMGYKGGKVKWKGIFPESAEKRGDTSKIQCVTMVDMTCIQRDRWRERYDFIDEYGPPILDESRNVVGWGWIRFANYLTDYRRYNKAEQSAGGLEANNLGYNYAFNLLKTNKLSPEEKKFWAYYALSNKMEIYACITSTFDKVPDYGYKGEGPASSNDVINLAKNSQWGLREIRQWVLLDLLSNLPVMEELAVTAWTGSDTTEQTEPGLNLGVEYSGNAVWVKLSGAVNGLGDALNITTPLKGYQRLWGDIKSRAAKLFDSL